MTERAMNKRDPLEYVINRMERAGQSNNPAANGYGKARRELLEGIAELRATNAALVAALKTAQNHLPKDRPILHEIINDALALAKGEK